MPNLNNFQFLAERFDSILNQTMDNWELIVVDGYSDDGAWELIQEYAARDDRISQGHGRDQIQTLRAGARHRATARGPRFIAQSGRLEQCPVVRHGQIHSETPDPGPIRMENLPRQHRDRLEDKTLP